MKILAWILVFLLLSGCQVVPLEPQQPVSGEPAEEKSAAEVQQTDPEQSAEEQSGYEPVSLVSLDGIDVTAVGYDADTAWGPTLTLELQNETEEDLLFWADYAKSDGVMCNPYWNCTVAAGETVRSQVFWSGEMLQKSGIAALGELVLELEICHSADNAVVLFSDTVSQCLQTENTSLQTPPVWEDLP